MADPTLLLILVVLLARGGAEPPSQYCGRNTPLQTQYFSSFLQEEQHAIGCVGAPAEDGFTHVIRLNTPGDQVHLQISGTLGDNVSLVLDSGKPTTWRLETKLSIVNILVSLKSHVVLKDGGVPSTSSFLDSPGKYNTSLITSYTTIDKANKIVIQLPQNLPTQPCDLNLNSDSPAVRAYTTTRILPFGCFHQEAAGLLPNDVHVIDLKTQPSASRSPRHALHQDWVEMNILPTLESQEPVNNSERRNMTIILKSDRPVIWKIKSDQVLGNLTIAAGNNTVDSLSLSTQQRLNIDKTEISGDFDALMRRVTDLYGLPLSYLRVHSANLLQIQIPPRSRREVSTFLERDRSNLLRDKETLPVQFSNDQQSNISDIPESIVTLVKNTMSKTCSISKISLTIPSSVVQETGIVKINLNDPSCTARDNGTHFVVSSHSTACGSTAMTYGEAPLYKNNLFLHVQGLEDEIRIPYLCKFRPGIPGISRVVEEEKEKVEVEEEEEEEREPDLDNIESGDEMYGIEVELIQAGTPTQLIKSKLDSAPVALHDQLYVQSHINAVRYLALAIEQCWLSSSPRVSSHAGHSDLKLVMAGCPAHPEVTMHWDKSSANAAFSFKISEDMSGLGKVWLQCRMGLCSATSAGAQGNIFRCEDPAVSCSASRTHRESSIQQVTVRGPLQILPVTRDVIGQIKPAVDPILHEPTLDQVEEEQDGAHAPQSTLVGVTVEVAVAISLASFLVGASSTGVLWFIHSKAEKVKTIQLRRIEGTELKRVDGSQQRRDEESDPVRANFIHLDLQNQPRVLSTHCQSVPSSDANGNCSGCPLLS